MHSPRPLRIDQALLAVLVRQYLVERERHGGGHALELGAAHGVQLRRPIPVRVLAAPDARALGRLALHQPRDVDEQPVADVDPPRVDHVGPVAALRVRVVRVDVEEVRLVHVQARQRLAVTTAVAAETRAGICVCVCVGEVARLGEEAVVVQGAVEVAAEVRQRGGGHLHVDVVVPGHDAAVPPPAQERAVREPGLDAELARRRQPRPDQVPQRRPVLRVRHRLPEVPPVVVPQLRGAARLVEVLGRVVVARFLIAELLLAVVVGHRRGGRGGGCGEEEEEQDGGYDIHLGKNGKASPSGLPKYAKLDPCTRYLHRDGGIR